MVKCTSRPVALHMVTCAKISIHCLLLTSSRNIKVSTYSFSLVAGNYLQYPLRSVSNVIDIAYVDHAVPFRIYIIVVDV